MHIQVLGGGPSFFKRQRTAQQCLTAALSTWFPFLGLPGATPSSLRETPALYLADGRDPHGDHYPTTGSSRTRDARSGPIYYGNVLESTLGPAMPGAYITILTKACWFERRRQGAEAGRGGSGLEDDDREETKDAEEIGSPNPRSFLTTRTLPFVDEYLFFLGEDRSGTAVVDEGFVCLDRREKSTRSGDSVNHREGFSLSGEVQHGTLTDRNRRKSSLGLVVGRRDSLKGFGGCSFVFSRCCSVIDAGGTRRGGGVRKTLWM